jgi:hypothetical protein
MSLEATMEELRMSEREIDRVSVIQGVVRGQLSWPQAAEQLGLSERQIGYLCARVKKEGSRGVIHRLRGRPSNHRLTDEGLIEKAMVLIEKRYPDFGPTFANEKLREKHGIELSLSTLRRRMIQKELWKPNRAKRVYRAWRERRACLGELVQLDGSHHDWFEGRGPRCVLLVYIDDATSRILYAEFVGSEDVRNLFKATEAYLRRCGRPVALYVDRDSIYVTSRKKGLLEQLEIRTPATHFTRAMNELGINVQTAFSPQAKGRVERGFKTHQDRLVKELRLREIKTLEQANLYLQKRYVPDHNQRCAVAPRNPVDAHRPILASQRLASILCVQEERTVFEDYTIRYRNRYFQILPNPKLKLRPKEKVTVEYRWNGLIRIKNGPHYLRYKIIDHPSYRPLITKPTRERKDPKPGSLSSAHKSVYVGPWVIERNSDRFHEVKI